MSNENKARLAHDVLDGLSAGRILSRENEQLLRSFLPDLPKQKTLAELTHDVYDAWGAAYGNDWADDVFGELETWLDELHKQLKGVAPAKPAHPEFLETEADYENAPEGTIAACDGSLPWHKFRSAWSSSAVRGEEDATMSGSRRRVLRWGEGK